MSDNMNSEVATTQAVATPADNTAPTQAVEPVTPQVQENNTTPTQQTDAETPQNLNVELRQPLGVENQELPETEAKNQNLFEDMEEKSTEEKTEGTEEQDKEKTDENKEEHKEEEQDKDPEDVIPEGEYILQGTDGKDVELAEGDSEKYQQIFRDAKLTQKQARMMVDAYKSGIAEATKLTVGKANEFYKQAYTKRNQAWRETIANDADLGGEHLNETRANIKRVMDKYATPEFKSYLNKTGECFNPELIKLFSKIGKDLGSDNFVGGNGVATRKESSYELAKRLYPNSPELWK